MRYKVWNDSGKFVSIKYACFGMLSGIGYWYDKDVVKPHDKDGNLLGKEFVIVNTENYGEVGYLKGFQPFQLTQLDWIVEFGDAVDPEEGWAVLEHLAKKHPLFKDVTVSKEEGIVSSPLGDVQMDKTMLPLFVMRDLVQENCHWLLFKELENLSGDVIARAFLSTLFYVHTRLDGSKLYHTSFSDGKWLCGRGFIGNYVDMVLWRREPIYSDDTWKNTDLGFASYGQRPDYEVEEAEYDGDDYEYKTLEGAPLERHPILGGRISIDSCAVTRGDFEGLEAKIFDHFWRSPTMELFSQILKLTEV